MVGFDIGYIESMGEIGVVEEVDYIYDFENVEGVVVLGGNEMFWSIEDSE